MRNLTPIILFLLLGNPTVVGFYVADQDTDGISELYAIRDDGSTVKVNGDLPTNHFINAVKYRISPDKKYVVFIEENIDLSAPFRLLSWNIETQGPMTDISGTIVSGGNVISFAISPDSKTVAFRADKDVSGQIEPYAVVIDGSSDPVRLGGTQFGANEDMNGELKWSPDSQRIVYSSDQDVSGVDEIFSVRPDGTGLQQVSAQVSTDAVDGKDSNTDFLITPDSSRVVYSGDLLTASVTQLFSAPIDVPGAISNVLMPTPASGGDLKSFLIAPNGSRVIYRADKDTNNVDELFSVPLPTGGVSTKLNAAPASGGDVTTSFQITPNSQFVVYRADQDINGKNEIYSVALAGGQLKRLNTNVQATGDVVSDFVVSSDSQRVVYRADADIEAVEELYSAAINQATSAVKLNNTLTATPQRVLNFAVSPDGSKVAYIADEDTPTINELYVVPIAGGTPQKLNGPFTGGQEVFGINVPTFSSDSNSISYIADQDTEDMNEVYTAPADGSETGQKVSGDFQPDGDANARGVTLL